MKVILVDDWLSELIIENESLLILLTTSNYVCNASLVIKVSQNLLIPIGFRTRRSSLSIPGNLLVFLCDLKHNSEEIS
jgi:hypothetical protein